MSYRNVSLHEHTLEKLPVCFTGVICGKRRSGKSTLGSHVMDKIYRAGVKRFVVFCGNRENMIEWQRKVPPLYVHELDLEAMERMKIWQDDRVGADRDLFETEEDRRYSEDPSYHRKEYVVPMKLRLCVFVDDAGSRKDIMHSKLFKDICTNGRHYGMYLVILIQYLFQMASENRDQIDLVWMMQTVNSKSIDKIYTEYVTSCCDRKEFSYLLAACTNRRGKAMYIDNSGGSLQKDDKLFFVKIPFPVNRTQVGGRQYIRYSREHYLSSKRQVEIMQKPQRKRVTITDSISALSRLDEGDEEDEESVVPHGSVVSLNRKRNINIHAIREGKETFRDTRGNIVQVQLQNHKGEKED